MTQDESPNESPDCWTQTTLFALLVVALGQLIQVSDGHYSTDAAWWLLLVSVLGTLTLVAHPVQVLEQLAIRTPVAVVLSGLVLQFCQILTHSPGIYLRPTGGWLAFLAAVGAGGVLAGSLAFAGPAWSRAGSALLAVCFLAAGLWLLRASPRPAIDVFIFQQEASDALLHGHDPYTLTFPNIYGHSQFYGAQVTDGRTLFFGFPYPPLSLGLAMLGFLATGDHRSAQLIAFVAAAALLLALRPDRLGALAAAALLFTPRGFFVLEQGWTEPFGVALLGLVLATAARAPRLLWLALGAFFAWKQYTVVLLPLTVLLLPRPFSWKALGRLLVPALLFALAISLPLALWDVRGFWHSVVWLQTVQPFRADALSFPSALLALGFTPPPVVPTLLTLTGLITAVVLWRAPRTLQGFAGGVTVVLGVFFAFNKQSFCNYWFMVLGASAFAFALAAGRAPSGSSTIMTTERPARPPRDCLSRIARR
jgi:hypothetical protein